MKRGLLVLLGVLLLVLGVVLIGAGATVAAVVGPDDSLSTSPAHLSGQGVALVAEDITIDESNLPVPSSVGSLTLSVTDPGGSRMFVGAATAKDVDTYLTGAPYDVVVDMSSGSTATTRPVPGSQQPKPPEAQTFWTSQATGRTATLASPITRTTTVVIMNADASKQVDADVVVMFTIKHVFTGSLIAAGVGLLLVLLAILAFWRARVAGRRKREAATASAVAADSPATVLPGASPVAPGPAVPEPPAEPDAATAVLAPVSVDAAPAGKAPVVADSPPSAATPVADSSFAAVADGTTPPDPVAVAPGALALGGAAGPVPGPTGATAPEAPQTPPVEVAAPAVAAAAAEPVVDEGVAVPAWAGSSGPDTLTGDELAAPPAGAAAVDGGFVDGAAQAAAVAGDTGAIAPVVAPDGTTDQQREPVAGPDDAPATEAAGAPAGPAPGSGAPATRQSEPPATSETGRGTEPFERVDAPLYDELASWFRDDGTEVAPPQR